MKSGKEIQTQILQNYFTITDNVATLKLVYDTFSELVNPNFGGVKIAKLNDKLLGDVREAASLLPRKFKLNLHIVIRDFGEYTREECENIIKQNIGLTAYCAVKENNKKLISGWSLIGAGAAILIVSYFLHNYELWFDLINISGTLFVWEGVNMAYIKRSFENRAARKLVKSIQNICIESENS